MQYVEVLAPTIVVALLFWVVIRAVVNADRSERRAEAEAEARRAEAAKETEKNDGEN